MIMSFARLAPTDNHSRILRECLVLFSKSLKTYESLSGIDNILLGFVVLSFVLTFGMKNNSDVHSFLHTLHLPQQIFLDVSRLYIYINLGKSHLYRKQHGQL